MIAVHPYWSFWEGAYSGNLRADKAALLERAVAAAAGIQFVAALLADGDAASRARLAELPADAILVVQSMAVPPGPVVELLSLREELPVVVWAVHQRAGLRDDFDHSDITGEGATVGTPQLLNLLQRRCRSYTLIVGRLDDPHCGRKVTQALVAASTAGRIKRARLGRVGAPFAGYDCVDADDRELARALGITVIGIEAEQLRQRYERVTDAQVSALAHEIKQSFSVADELEGDRGLTRSLKLAAALEQLDADLRVDMGAMNCHVPALRFCRDPGISACFALGRETSRGIPWSCTGDVLAPIAMLTTKLLSGCAIYHEIEALDVRSNEALLANSGEHDLSWSPREGKPRLHRNPWFSGDATCGACACYTPAGGQATLLAFTPHADERSGFRFVAAEGELSARTFPLTGTVNGAFRFQGHGASIEHAWTQWAESGVNHHASLARGHLADQARTVARLLKVGFVQVS